jgi:hypothetical protein
MIAFPFSTVFMCVLWKLETVDIPYPPANELGK